MMSKFTEANEKIAEAVVEGYEKIEDGVVGGYKKLEDGVVTGFNKVNDKIIGAVFSKDGETVEETKARLSGEKKSLKKVQGRVAEQARPQKILCNRQSMTV